MVEMYETSLRDVGYVTFKLPRTNNRGDGLLTALHTNYFNVLSYQELLFNDIGDRVAQLLHVESNLPSWQRRDSKIQRQILIVNTHLLFPHDHSCSIVRLHEVYKILQYVESYQKEQKLDPIPIILCGDWNGSKRGQVYKFLRSQGFVSSYDTAHHYSDNDVDAHKWVSHHNHRGNICGVDFIWLLNPNKYRKPLKVSWNEAIFGTIKCLVRLASQMKDDAVDFLKADCLGGYITYSSTCQALRKLGLSTDDIEHFRIQVNIDGKEVLYNREFQWTEQTEGNQGEKKEDIKKDSENAAAIGFDVNTAFLFPPEVEKGTWPENYSLSDHAPLTVVFSPQRMACSQPSF